METKGNMSPEMNEHDKTVEYKVTCIAPEGLGYGEGSISVKTRLEDPNDPLTVEVLEDVNSTITGGEILVPIESDDDGCPDGRRAGRIMKGFRFIEKHYNRAKGFGGGLTMSVASRVGLGRAKEDLKESYEIEAAELEVVGLNHGGHTGKNATGTKCGCAAVDEAPVITSNASKYKDKIKTTFSGIRDFLYRNGVDASEENSDEVLENFEEYDETHTNTDYTGKAVMEDVVLGKEKVVAELEDDHFETAIIINAVEDMTVNQELIRSVSRDVAQVFGIDLPRKLKIANERYKNEDESVKSKAVLSMLAYAFSTSATLTDGTLPVYIIEPVEQKEKAAEPEPALV